MSVVYDGTEGIGRALVIGVVAMVAWNAAGPLALVAGAGSAFCAGRWIAKKAKEGRPWA